MIYDPILTLTSAFACFYMPQVTLVLQALMAIQDLRATRVGMGSLAHLVKREKQVKGVAGNPSK